MKLGFHESSHCWMETNSWAWRFRCWSMNPNCFLCVLYWHEVKNTNWFLSHTTWMKMCAVQMSISEKFSYKHGNGKQSLSVPMSTTQDQIIQIAQNQSTWGSLSFLVSFSYIIVINAGGVVCVLVRMCMEERFQAGHVVLCNGPNQIVVRNFQGPLRMAERREEVKGRRRSGGTHRGSFAWWHGETDPATSPHCCSHLCV